MNDEIREMIQEGMALENISDKAVLKEAYGFWCASVKRYMQEHAFSDKWQEEVRVKMHYTDNEYAEHETIISIRRAIHDAVQILKEIGYLSEQEKTTAEELSLLEKMLDNFYMYYRAMYRNPVHKKGTLSPTVLSAVRVGNEYDLQRMLYSVLLPLFPTIRQEVYSDNGYGGMRADMYLDTCDLVIETKCTHDHMSEKRLAEELGADGFHYPAGRIYFYIWDKCNIIKNSEAFRNAFERDMRKDGKLIKVFILQTIDL